MQDAEAPAQDAEDQSRAFDTFRALRGESSAVERDELFRNMAQLFSFVSDRCDDAQVSQYDDVLCQLAELVEAEARSQVASLLAPLDRAPGTVVVKLARDSIEVARPLLEFSSVLSDDDLIEIASERSEEHRTAIAGRASVAGRVGEAIVEHGADSSVSRLVENENAHIDDKTMARIVERAADNEALTERLRSRTNVDWRAVELNIGAAGMTVLRKLSHTSRTVDKDQMQQASNLVFKRMRNQAGFSASEWKVAWGQVKALNDRHQLDTHTLTRFGRFGYGHHLAAAMIVLLKIKPEVFLKWLASQDYMAMTIASRSLGIDPALFEQAMSILPWYDQPEDQDIENACAHFEALDRDEAKGIFDLWREHAFRRKATDEEQVAASG